MVDNLLNEADTLIGGKKMPPDGLDVTGVPRAWTCEQHGTLMQDIGEIKAMLHAEEKRANGIAKRGEVIDAAAAIVSQDALRREGRINERLAVIETKMLIYAGIATFILSPVTAAITAAFFKWYSL